MDIDGGLPYDRDDSAPEHVSLPPREGATGGGDGDDVNMMLDRPLDDFIPHQRGGGQGRAPREPIPDHVQSLMGRMGKGKVYLAEESPGIIHHDAERRIARDPRLARLALELDKQDPTSWLAAISETATSVIRPNALFVASDLIKHLSTSKVFTWASEFGAGVMGIEWLNDSTLILLFPTPAAALLSLSMLSKAGFDPTEGDDPLMERAAHGFPASLLPRRSSTPEAEAEAGDSQRGAELLGGGDGGDDGVQRRGRGAFRADREPRGSANGRFDLAPLAGGRRAAEQPFAEGVDPHARVTVRYATEDDNTKFKRGARESKWYERHGRRAGKETSGSRRGNGGWDEPVDLKDRVGTRGEGRDFARRIGRERYEPYDRRERGERGPPRRARVEDLDADLDVLARRRRGEDDADEGVDIDADRSRDYGGRYARRGPVDRDGGRRRREPRAREDLDAELDAMLAARGKDEAEAQE